MEKNFMICVQKFSQLRDTFISCKSLEKDYDAFKIILKGYTYEE